MIKLVFRHPDMPPALNGSKGLIRMHWTKRAKTKEKFAWLIKEQKPSPIRGKVKLTMVNYAIMPMDWDNFASRMKIPNDCLVNMGMIEDDSPKVIVDFDPYQVKVSKKSEVRLEFIFESINTHES